MALPKTSTRNRARGFTLVEIIVVLVLIAAIGGFGLIVSLDSYRDFSFHNERDTLLPLFDKARNQAVTNSCIGSSCTGGVSHGVYFGMPGKYVLFQGTSYISADHDASVDEIVESKNAGVTVASPVGLAAVVFLPERGSIAAYKSDGTILPGNSWSLTVSDSAGHTSTLTFNIEGQITWTN